MILWIWKKIIEQNIALSFENVRLTKLLENKRIGLVNDLKKLEPFGVGNKKPIFAGKDIQINRIKNGGINHGSHCSRDPHHSGPHSHHQLKEWEKQVSLQLKGLIACQEKEWWKMAIETNELIEAASENWNDFKKKLDVYKMAEANKAFARFASK